MSERPLARLDDDLLRRELGMTDIAEKLLALTYRALRQEDHNGHDTIREIEAVIGENLPEDYTEFLSAFPSTGACYELVSVRGIETFDFADDGCYPWNILYAYSGESSYNILDIHEESSHRWIGYLAIGEDIFGNKFFMNLSKNDFGSILFSEMTSEMYSEFYKISNSFYDFIDRTFVENLD